MKTIFLPGFSIRNRDWAEEIGSQIGEKIGLEIHYWPHWQTGEAEPGWIDMEVDKVLEEIGNQTVNILAKSIGTLVAIRLLNKKTEVANKVLLCGVPLTAFKDGDKESYGILAKLAAEKVLVIQNENDNVGSFESVRNMFADINPKIRIMSKPREDHDYPYVEEFVNFLGEAD